MSYSRWSNSAWYSFYNVNGCLSLWYSVDKTYDWLYEDAVDLLQLDPEEIHAALIEIYQCTVEEAAEAVEYIKMFIDDYDPAVEEQFKQELQQMLDKLKED